MFVFQGGPFATAWQTRYAKLYPNRLELQTENNKPELIFMDQIEEINAELTTVGLSHTGTRSVQGKRSIKMEPSYVICTTATGPPYAIIHEASRQHHPT